ncbi:SGNH/GDSL hydrolase family protein [Cryobacterium sinapicolor]|uniref:SGNH/GDSL hydrolase family protein n=1 Tax=Cryobacterium sinapicolor TaxID=1259236 RepID=A0ABY2JC08_9MICO|nr:SGNH/GDSL hydrolase family protein [Cryobacterium sinapicolor]TFD02503.1 SGNH/GDSL hydrolase family protein [Cryobacterium sinapicolor]
MKTRTRVLSSVIAAVLSASGVLAAGALPASAAPTAPVNKYVALGDSYAAGQGGLGYVDSCLQSPNGYPALLDAVKGTNLLRNVSCSLATTGDVTTTQLSSLNRGTTLVTLTVGGNDLNVAGVAAACASADPVACGNAISTAGALLYSGELAARLADTYAQVAVAAPKAHVVVTGYPLLFAPSADPLIAQLNGATIALNQTIQGVVAQAQATRPNSSIEYVDVSAAFEGHAIGDIDSWVIFAGPDAFHPTPVGYQAYAEAIQAAL